MEHKYKISNENLEELKKAQQLIRDENAKRRIQALIMYADGRTGKEIAETTGYSRPHLYKLYQKYTVGGLKAITETRYVGNHRNMSFEEETAFLEPFINKKNGKLIPDVSVIKAAYDKQVGHVTGHGQIYYVLHRHGWKKNPPKARPRKRKTYGFPRYR